MITAAHSDKELIIDILTSSFDANQSVNYIIRKDQSPVRRIRALIEYCLQICSQDGKVFVSADGNACALILYPDQKRTTVYSILSDVKLVFKCIGFKNVEKTLKREALIKKIRPKESMAYLWYIGVRPESQGKGIGSTLLTELIEYCAVKNRPLYLETSTLRNLPWYQEHGFKIYHQEDLGYKLYFLNNKPESFV